MTVPAAKVTGIRDIQRALRQVDGQSQKKLREVGNRAVQRIVVKAQANASTPMEKAAAATLRAQSQQRYAAIKLGRARVPFALGAEFGAGRNSTRRRSTGTYVGYRQFKPWRGNGEDAGYFMYPAIRAERQQTISDYLAGIGQLLDQAGFR